MSAFKKNANLILIPLVIVCNFFASTGLFFIKSYHLSKQVGPGSIPITSLFSTFPFGWFVFSFVGRLIGAYFFGKYAAKVIPFSKKFN